MAFLYFLQFTLAFGLIITILMHSPKGEGMGAIGGNARIFQAPKGLEAGLDRLTLILATGFVVLSLIIAISSR